MAQAAGVVKGLIGGGATVINNITGETRTLNIGDIVCQNKKITTNDTDIKLTITQNDGKDITLIGQDILMLDQSTSSNEGFGNKTVADTTALQQAILTGTDLNALEETAAGGASGGEGVSSALLNSFASSIPNGYHVYRHTDGRDYLTPNDPTAPTTAGNDTLKVADGSIDFSRVKNFEKLDLTNGEQIEITLRASDVLNMTDNNNRLRIDGDKNDKVDIDNSGFTQKTDLIEGGVTYHQYEATYTDNNGNHTVTLEVKEQAQVI